MDTSAVWTTTIIPTLPQQTLSFKFNLKEINENPQETIILALLNHVSVRPLNSRVTCDKNGILKRDPLTLCWTAGLNLDGKNNEDHIHLHIQPMNGDFIISSNLSRERAKCSILRQCKISMRHSVAQDAYSCKHHLAYPYKEGRPIELDYHLSVEPYPFDELLTIGTALYEKEEQERKRKARLDDKQKTLLRSVNDIVKNAPRLAETHHAKGMFTAYGTILNYVFSEYHKGLELDEYPCGQDLKRCVQKVCIYQKVDTAFNIYKQ